jgi:hypothetical protein
VLDDEQPGVVPLVKRQQNRSLPPCTTTAPRW